MTRRSKKLASAAATLLVFPFTCLPGALAEEPASGSESASRQVSLDPAAILAQARRGEPIRLPTVDADVVVEASFAPRAFVLIEAGPTAPIAHPQVLDLWTIRNQDGVSGILWLNGQWVKGQIETPAGLSMIENVDTALPATDHVVYGPSRKTPPGETSTRFDARPLLAGDPAASAAGASPSGPTAQVGTRGVSRDPATGVVTRAIVIYGDGAYRSQYGWNWGAQAAYVVELANQRFSDVGLQYKVTYVVDGYGEFDTDSMDAAYLALQRKSYLGANSKALFSYRDYDGCNIGAGDQPGTVALVQHAPDACHSWLTPTSDFDRAYMTKHELGHNNDADHAYAWIYSSNHVHRSIMYESAWHHYHDAFSDGNKARMRKYLGT